MNFADTLSQIDRNVLTLKACFEKHPALFVKCHACFVDKEGPSVHVFSAGADADKLSQAARATSGDWRRHKEWNGWTWRGTVDGVLFEWKGMEPVSEEPESGSPVNFDALPKAL
jgi:hypothetical protein